MRVFRLITLLCLIQLIVHTMEGHQVLPLALFVVFQAVVIFIAELKEVK